MRFALTGNARRQDGRLIVSATLYETADVQPVWSQRFDHPESPDAWDSITVGIADSINQATIDAEVARAERDHPDSLDKRDLMFAARATSLQQGSKANFLQGSRSMSGRWPSIPTMSGRYGRPRSILHSS